MVLPEDKYDPIVDALNRINESLEEQNDTLRKISQHYDSVVPVMKRNAGRVDEAHSDNRSALDKMYEVFSN